MLAAGTAVFFPPGSVYQIATRRGEWKVVGVCCPGMNRRRAESAPDHKPNERILSHCAPERGGSDWAGDRTFSFW